MLSTMINITRKRFIHWVSEHSFCAKNWFAIITTTGRISGAFMFFLFPSIFIKNHRYRKVF
jgi:hypothetical protein